MSNTSEDALSASTSSFLTSLTVNSAIAGGEVVAFILLRNWVKAIYEPRTYIPPTEKQASVLGTHLFWPLWKIIWSDPELILEKNGVDPYVYVRFLILMSKAMIPIWVVSWVIILPVDSVNTSMQGKDGLDRFTMGNISRSMQDRLWTHLILEVLFIGWILYLIFGEMHHWLIVRQKYLISPQHSKLPQASTILVTGIPNSYMDEQRLEELYAPLPGGVKQIWLNRNLKEMPDLWERRAFAAQKLESAEVKLVKLARARRNKLDAQIAKLEKKGKEVPSSLHDPANPLPQPDKTEGQAEPHALDLADQLVPRSQRPTIRLKPKWAPFSLGFLGIGQKVDAIEWARKEILEVEPLLEQSRKQLEADVLSPGTREDTFPPRNSAFIRFNQQIAAHMAADTLAHHMPYQMHKRYIEQSPENVIWRSLGLNPYEQNIRQAISYAATVGLIIAWSFPVAFIGALSNVSTLTETYHWLRWIQGDSFAKKLLQGVISGLLPPVLLALLMMLLPAVLRQLAALEGLPSKTEVELSLMTRYFLFLVIHTFIIVTLSSGLIASIKPIAENPGSVATQLATNLPTASTFFLTLILTQFTGLAGTLLQAISLVLYYVKVILFGATPRSVYSSRYRLRDVDWGTEFPSTTVYVVIMIGYCIISPVINGFAAAYFAVSVVVYKYLWIWVYDQPTSQDSGGLFFPKAINHVFVGIYIQQVCLCALFFLARNDHNKVSALPQGIIMIVLIVATVGVQYVLNVSYMPLKHSLPLTLAHLSYGMSKPGQRGSSIIGEDEFDESAHAKAVAKTLERPPEDTGRIEKLLTERKNTLDKLRDNLEKVGPGEQGSSSPKQLSDTPRESSRLPSPFQTAPATPQPEYGPGTSSPEEIEEMELSPRSSHSATMGFVTAPGPPIGPTHPIHQDEDGINPRDFVNRDPDPDVQAIEMGIMNQSPDPEQDDQPEKLLVQPGGPGISREREVDEKTAFFHPATKEPMRILWIPNDSLGLAKAEIEACEKIGIRATSRDAVLTNKGRTKIFGKPPDDL